MRRFVGWKISVIVVLSAYGAFAPLEVGSLHIWCLADYPLHFILYLILTGLGVASYCLRYYKVTFASGLASAALCLWTYWRVIWLPLLPITGLAPIARSRLGSGWLIWLAVVVFLCVVAVQEGIAHGKKRRDVNEHGRDELG